MDGRRQRTNGVVEANSRGLSIGIIGGGLVGALAAISLANVFQKQQKPVQIELFERHTFDASGVESSVFEAQYDARNLVLSSATAAFFKTLGIWRCIERFVVPIETLKISRLHGRGRSQISAQDEGVQALGYVADMAHLAVQLNQIAVNLPEVTCHYGVEVAQLVPLQAGYCATIVQKDGRETCAEEKYFDLVVAADGKDSWVCEHLGLKATSKAYQQHALVANVSMDRPMPNIAYEQFINGGAVTLLPLTQSGFTHRMALVLIDAPDTLEKLQTLSEAGFLQHLARSLPLEAVFSKKGPSKIYPLHYQLRHERARPHLIVIGSAAQSLHPIAAQGFNLAVRDIRDFIQIVSQYERDSQNSGALFSGAMMQQFTVQRAADVRKVRGFVDLLNHVFFTQQRTPLLGFVQDVALLGFELVPGAKAGLSRFAMGGA